jgi:hypothetical protein
MDVHGCEDWTGRVDRRRRRLHWRGVRGQFLAETFDGKRVSGSLKPDPGKKPVVQIAETSVPLPDVSAVQPFERKFWSRFDAGLDFGYSMTRTNSAKQLSLGGNLSYRDEHHVDVLFANVFRFSQENALETQRWDLGNDFRPA